MTQTTLTAAQAQRLIEQGSARLHGPERLTTPRATYVWNTTSQVYEREGKASIWESGWLFGRPPRSVRLVALVGLLLIGCYVFFWIPTASRPGPDWSATLRSMEGKRALQGNTRGPYFAPDREVDGWPAPMAPEAVLMLDCVRANVGGPHTLPTRTEWDALLRCAREKAFLVTDEELPKGYPR